MNGAWEAAEVLLDDLGLAVMPFAGPAGGWVRFSGLHRDEDFEKLTALGTIVA